MSGLSRAMRSAVARVREAFRGKELAGTDKLGNKYYRWTERAHGELKERRQVTVAKGDLYYNPVDIPSEWRMWLQKSRQDAPTMAELERSEGQAEAMKQRVKALQEQENIRAFRARAAGGSGPSASSGSYMEQLSSKLSEEERK